MTLIAARKVIYYLMKLQYPSEIAFPFKKLTVCILNWLGIIGPQNISNEYQIILSRKVLIGSVV